MFYKQCRAMTKHRQQSMKFKVKGKDLIWIQICSSLLQCYPPWVADANLLRRNWPVGGCLQWVWHFFPEWIIFFFLGFISVKMNSFSNSREVCINRSVTHGSKLQKLARSRGAVLVVTHKPCERRNKISREQSEVWRQKAFNASVIHCSFSGCGR